VSAAAPISTPPLRLGVWVDPGPLPAWLCAAVENARAVPGVTLTHVFVEATPRGRRRSRLFDVYERIDRRVFREGDDPFAPQAPTAAFAGARVQRVAAADACVALRDAGVDVLLHAGSAPLASEALEQPALGVWTWSQLEAARRGAAPYLRNLETAEPTSSALWLLRPEPWVPRVLIRSSSALDPSDREGGRPISLHRARFGAYWKGALFPARALRRSLADLAAMLDKAEPADPLPDDERPGPLRTARLACLVSWRFAVRRWRNWRFDARWELAVQPRQGGLPGEAMDRFERLPTAPGRFYADPFLVRDGDTQLLFFEDGDQATELGRVSCMELDASGTPGAPFPILAEDHHLSYPCVFRWADEWWMIPETAAARRVALYRAESFPHRWMLDRVLFDDVHAVDATVHVADDRLWLFVSMAERGGRCLDELFLFHAADPRGPWVPHPENPVVSDVRYGRSAGALFEHRAQLHRPAQDGSKNYGGAIVLMRVEVLSEHQYRESVAARIEPDWCPGAIATHSFAHGETLDVVDARILRPRF